MFFLRHSVYGILASILLLQNLLCDNSLRNCEIVLHFRDFLIRYDTVI